MSRDEREFAGHVVQALTAAGFVVEQEVPIPGKRRMDILAPKEGVVKGIEVKFNNRGLLDDLVKGTGDTPRPGR